MGDPPGLTLRPALAERKAEVTPSPTLTVEPCSQPAVGRGGLLTSSALRITSCLGTTCSSPTATFPGAHLLPGSPGEPTGMAVVALGTLTLPLPPPPFPW